jgi:hypothetical protein
MFFRDDVIAWNKRVQGKAPNTHPLKPAQLKPLVQRNVKDCVERLQLVSSSHSVTLLPHEQFTCAL